MTKDRIKDMVISIIVCILATISIVFYFLPSITIRHDASNYKSKNAEVVNVSGFDTTRSLFLDAERDFKEDSKYAKQNEKMEQLIAIRDKYPKLVIPIAIASPILVLTMIVSAVFTLLSWLKNEKFKHYAFITTICSMAISMLFMICIWMLANKFNNGNNLGVFMYNLKGSASYGAFTLLILAFVNAIVVCVHNYFIGYADEEEDEEEEEIAPIKVKKTANFCPNCGGKISSENKTCPNCGEKLR